jgi:uncharacterized membrane protein
MILRGRTLLLAGCLFLLTALPVRAQEPSVRTILFYSPDEEACRAFLNDVLPPLLVEHGQNLTVLTIDVDNAEGRDLYQSALSAMDIPPDDQFIPLIVMENAYLSGLADIREKLPGLIADRLQGGGTEWPDIPGMEDILRKAGFTRAPETPWEKFASDLVGNTLAVIVLAGLILSLFFSILVTFRPAPKFLSDIPDWVFPVLLIVGFAVASYLTHAELTQSDVICGGISRCQDVHESQYSRIFGVITVGEFGILGYLLIGLAWLAHRYLRGRIRTAAAIAMYGFAVFGVTYSSYLTFLEPFVIGATCLWCLASAVVMSLILPLTTLPVREVLQPHPTTGKRNPSGAG